MRPTHVFSVAIAALALMSLVAAAAPARAQATFKVPFAFESGGKKFPAGDYVVTRTGDAQVTFRQVSTGKETALPVVETLKPAAPPAAESRIVFDETGAFEPSYTEYFTIYVVGEVWLSGQEGYLIHVTKGAHKNKVVWGQIVQKAITQDVTPRTVR
jgi:hypothetical protein